LTPLALDNALDVRDVIAKALYSCLFSWLVERINQIICVTTTTTNNDENNSIAILDIFGFEKFTTNGFEQLCINYANETLQFYFNKHIFKMEQEEYLKEKINWKSIDYIDNSQCIDMLAKKPNGIIHILDDESNLPQTSDFTFLEKCHYLHSANKLYAKPRMLKTPDFLIKHYAGEVNYEVRHFLDKNRDLLKSDVIEMLINSTNSVISKMFHDLKVTTYENQRTINCKTGYITMKPRVPTVAAKFHDSLKNLLDQMSKCTPWFIRCIKPNNNKQPMKFEMRVVLEQLNYTGMIETVRIRKLGFPVRYKFSVFNQRFRVFISNSKTSSSQYQTAKELSIFILSKIDLNKFKFMYQIGLTKVFLREILDKYLEQQRKCITFKAAIQIQKNIKMFIQKKKYLQMRSAIIKLQYFIRKWLYKLVYIYIYII
jgi:myosin XV